MRTLPFAAAVAALAFGSARAHASPEDVFGFGPRSSAMGATGTADGEGFETVYSNPALLSLERTRSLTIGIQGALFHLHANGPLEYEPLRGTIVGATLPIPFGGPLKDRIALGFGFFTPLDLVVRARILFPETPQFLIPDRTQSVAVQAGMGIDIGHGIRVGGGFAALAALSGTVNVATDSSGHLGTTVEDTLLASYAPTFGASVDFGPDYRVGLVYRGDLVGRFDVVINVHDLGSITVPPLNISGVPQYDPWELDLEVARVGHGPWHAAIGAVYKHWSGYPGPAEATVRCPTIDPTTGMPFMGQCTAPKPAPPKFSDTVSPHAGVERTIDLGRDVTLALRGGAFFEPTPAPEQTGQANLFDNARVALTAGYGVKLGGRLPPIAFDGFAQSQILVPRTDDKTKADPVLGKTVATGGVIGAFGATAGVKF